MIVNIKLILLACILSAFISCSVDADLAQKPYGSFSIDFNLPTSQANTRVQENALNDITHMVITIKTMDGLDTEYSSRKVEVYQFEGAYLSENLLLPLGSYQITTLYLVDSKDNVLFATPNKDVLLAQNVENALPITNIISKGTNNIIAEVLSTNGLTPQDFGMESLDVKFQDVFYFFVALMEQNQAIGFLPGKIEVLSGEYSHQQEINSHIQKINLKPIKGNYKIKFESEHYHPFEGSFSYDSLLSYVFVPLIIELERLPECVGGTYLGNVILNTQEEVDDFGSKCYTKIEGYLRIVSSFPEDAKTIKDLSPLESVQVVTGHLGILKNMALQSLRGLHNLNSVGGYMAIEGNEVLESLTSLGNLNSIGSGLEIANNHALTNLDGLQGLSSLSSNSQIKNNRNLLNFKGLDNLKIVGHLYLSNNEKLNSIQGLENLENIGGLDITGNNSLASLSGFGNSISSLGHLNITGNPLLVELQGMFSADGNIQSSVTIDNNATLESLLGLEFHNDIVFTFELKNNPRLTDISAMSDINTIGRDLIISNNEKLPNLTGLENLFSVGNLYRTDNDYLMSIVNNKSLKNFCALSYLFQEGILYKHDFTLNAFNPSVDQMKENNCAL